MPVMRAYAAVLVAATAGVACGFPRQSAANGSAAVAANTPSPQGCTPTIVLLERRMHLNVLNEPGIADLFVAACRETMSAMKPEERTSLAKVLRERAPSVGATLLRSCDAVTGHVPPDMAVIQALEQRLGARVVTDWCWNIVSIQKPS